MSEVKAGPKYLVDINELANLIKIKRKKNGLSLDEVAYETGVSKATISRIENGKSHNPGLISIERLYKWVGVIAIPYYECVIASQPAPAPSEPAGHWDLNEQLIRRS